jgi:hypothetical protein
VILYLDFDGVLDPDDVGLDDNGRPALRGQGALFEYASRLERILAPHPALQLVLSTSWVRVMGYAYARRCLPPALRERVVGATWHTRFAEDDALATWWIHEASRYAHIAHDLARRQPQDWLAIDDDLRGWPADAGRHLVACDPRFGLSEPRVRLQLEKRLARIAKP